MRTTHKELTASISQLVNAHAHSKGYTTKGEHLAAEIGYLIGWLSSIAESDWSVRRELEARLAYYKPVEGQGIVMHKRKE